MAAIKVRNSEGYKSEIYSKGHMFFADEPEKKGGSDTGADPYELLIAALGSCKAITMRMYAERKKIPLNNIEINLMYKKIHAEDCRNCESKDGKIGKIDVSIKFTGDLSEDQISSLIKISKKCPVHKTLISEIKINTNKGPDS